MRLPSGIGKTPTLSTTGTYRRRLFSEVIHLYGGTVMEQAAQPAIRMKVPLVVEAKAAQNWEEAH